MASSYYRRRRGMAPALLEYITRAYRQLLDEAKRALEKESIPTAIVFAHAAAEVCIEWVISNLLRLRGVQDLATPILEMSWHVGARLDLYTALSGDEIKKKPLWTAFEKHRKHRNNLFHQGLLCSKADAEESVKVVEKLLNHLEKVLGDKQGK